MNIYTSGSQPGCRSTLRCREIVPGVSPIIANHWSLDLFCHLWVPPNIDKAHQGYRVAKKVENHWSTHTQTHTHTYAHKHTHTHTQTQIHTLSHTLTHTHTDSHIHTHTHIHPHTLIHTHTYSHAHTLIHTHTHTHTRAQTHSHTHTQSLLGLSRKKRTRSIVSETHKLFDLGKKKVEVSLVTWKFTEEIGGKWSLKFDLNNQNCE